VPFCTCVIAFAFIYRPLDKPRSKDEKEREGSGKNGKASSEAQEDNGDEKNTAEAELRGFLY